MAGWIPPRLRPLIGADLDALNADAVQNIIGFPEDFDLEFKRAPHEGNDAGRKELAYDIAQFANSNGGLLVVGIEEDRGNATGFVPVTLDVDFGQ